MRNFINMLTESVVPNVYDDSIWYRGTNHTGPLQIGDGRNGDMLGAGIYFTNDPEYAAKFGKHVLEYQLILSSVLDEQDAPRVDGRMMSGKMLNNYARKNHYDAILASVGSGIYQLCVFSLDFINPVEEDELSESVNAPIRFSRANPTARTIRSMIMRSEDRKLRGMIAPNGDLFWWDAYYATHQTGAMELGIEYGAEGDKKRLFATMDLDDSITIDGGSDEYASYLAPLAQTVGEDDFLFTGWDGRWTAEEFLEQLNA
jgi:hypothetical protein